jgi:Spy/CpxP family protein refolding chaperone
MRTRYGKMIAGAAVLAFAAALAFPALAAAQEKRPAPPPRDERPARMLAREALDLTPEQEKALADFRKARADEAKAFRDEMTKLSAERRELAKDPKANQAKIDALIDKTWKLRAEREKAGFRTRLEMDKIFTPEQRERMRAFRQRLADRPGLARRTPMGPGRMGFRGPVRNMGRGFGPQRLHRMRLLRDRLWLRQRRIR